LQSEDALDEVIYFDCEKWKGNMLDRRWIYLLHLAPDVMLKLHPLFVQTYHRIETGIPCKMKKIKTNLN